jgi:hypothetical protein
MHVQKLGRCTFANRKYTMHVQKLGRCTFANRKYLCCNGMYTNFVTA